MKANEFVTAAMKLQEFLTKTMQAKQSVKFGGFDALSAAGAWQSAVAVSDLTGIPLEEIFQEVAKQVPGFEKL